MYRTVVLGAMMFGLVLLAAGCGEHPYFVAGDEIQLQKSTPLESITGDPRAFDGEPVLVEGTVMMVCQGAGCWAKVITESPAETLFVKSLGDKVLLPKACAGDRIRVEGPVIIVEPEPVEEVAEVVEETMEEVAEAVEEAVEEVVEVAQAETDELIEEECAGAGEGGCPKPQFFVSMNAVELFRR